MAQQRKTKKKAIRGKGPKKGEGGAPKKDINHEQLKKLCQLQCTLHDVASVFDIDVKTLNRILKDTYGETFSQYFSRNSGPGRVSLRRAMYHNAVDRNNGRVQVFLAKNWLGYSDKIQTEEVGNAAVVRLEMPLKRKRDE